MEQKKGARKTHERRGINTRCLPSSWSQSQPGARRNIQKGRETREMARIGLLVIAAAGFWVVAAAAAAAATLDVAVVDKASIGSKKQQR